MAQTPAQSLKIGGLFSLTSYGASWGVDELKAVQLAIDEANQHGGVDGRDISLIVEDTQSTPSTAITAMDRLIMEGVSIVIGPTWDDITAAIAPVAEQRNIILISPSTSGAVEEDIDFPYVFSTDYSYRAGTEALERFLAGKGTHDIVIVYNLNTWSQYMQGLFVQAAPSYNLTIRERFPLQDQTPDFKTILLRIKEEKADAVFVAFETDDPLELFLKQAQEAGLDVPIVIASPTEDPQKARWYSAYSAGTFHYFPRRSARLQELAARFKERFGAEPTSPSVGPAYDAASLTISALRSGARSGPELRRYLDTVTDLPGVSVGKLSFDEKGLIKADPDAFTIRTVKDGRFVTVGASVEPEQNL